MGVLLPTAWRVSILNRSIAIGSGIVVAIKNTITHIFIRTFINTPWAREDIIQLAVQDAFAFKRKKWYYLILDDAHNASLMDYHILDE